MSFTKGLINGLWMSLILWFIVIGIASVIWVGLT